VVEPDRPPAYRSPRLQVRVVAAAAFTAGAIALSQIAPEGLGGAERDLLRAIAKLPSWLINALVTLSQVVAAYTPLAVVVVLLVFRRWRRMAGLVVSFGVAALATDTLRTELFDEGPIRSGVRELFENRLATPVGFPDAGYLAGIVALLVLEGAWLPARWRRVVRVAVAVLVVAQLVSGAILPRNALLAVAVGTLVGRLGQLVWGAPRREPSGLQLADALGEMGIVARRLVARGGGAATDWVVDTADGGELLVQATTAETRSALAPARIYRAIRLRNLGEERPFASVEHLAEHEALAALQAHSNGVATPELVCVGRSEPDAVLVVLRYRRGRRLVELGDEELTDSVLRGAWQVAGQLREARVAHRRLRLEHLWLGDDGEVFVTGFERAELGASRELLGNDVAELLVSMAARVGPARAAEVAVATLGADPPIDSLPRLQPLALSRATRKEVAGTDLIAEAAEAVRKRTGARPAAPAEVERLRPRTLLLIVLVAIAVYLLVPQLAGAGDIWSRIRDADPWWFAATLAASATTYFGAALAIAGCVATPLPYLPNVVTQLAAAFTGFATPAQLGGMALNTRFMQRHGVDSPVAVAAVGLNAVSAVAVHLVLLVAFAIATGSNGFAHLHLPEATTIAVVAGVVLGLAGLLLALPFGRRLVLDRIAPFLRRAGAGLAEVGRHPTKLLELVGGAVLVSGGYIVALWLSVSALGADAPVATVGFVFLTASVVSSAAPTPGGLGAVEATLVAGLRGAGLSGSEALGAVLLYRVATFWLPILPGVFAFRHLERTEQI
jgi:undecaprenyl-diphosphatase